MENDFNLNCNNMIFSNFNINENLNDTILRYIYF